MKVGQSVKTFEFSLPPPLSPPPLLFDFTSQQLCTHERLGVFSYGSTLINKTTAKGSLIKICFLSEADFSLCYGVEIITEFTHFVVRRLLLSWRKSGWNLKLTFNPLALEMDI